MENFESREQKMPTPDELATILEVNSNSTAEDKSKEGWIMSVSKTFCATTAALMAADGKFGDNKMDATLLSILLNARKQYPDRSETINKYMETILDLGWGEITMSELMSHRSGLIQGDSYFEPGELSNLDVYNSPEIVGFDKNKKGKVFSYCNPGFILAEDVMSLVAENFNEGYYGELKNRIIEPLGLKHTKSIYDSEEAKKAVSEVVKVENVIYDWGVESKESVRLDPLKTTKKGRIALSEGGLCSSVGDLEEFYTELSKLACGIPNKFVVDQRSAQEVHGFYLDAYKAGESCESDSQRELSLYCSKHYSLGVILEAIDEKGNVVSSRGNEDRTKIRFHHLGNQPGNDADASVTMPFSFADFVSGTANLNGAIPESSASISQKDVFTKDSLLTIVSCDYIAKMDEYFSSKCNKGEDQTYNDEWRTYNQYWEAARTGKNVAEAWQAGLISEGRLPKNFSEFHDEVREAYAPANEALISYTKEHFFTDGIIDSEKVKVGLKTFADFKKVKKAIEPQILEAQAKVADIFTRSDQQLKLEIGDSSKVEQESPAEWTKRVGGPKVSSVAESFQKMADKEAKQEEGWKKHLVQKDIAKKDNAVGRGEAREI